MSLSIAASGETGNLDAHLFENDSVGLARGLFWRIHVPCTPVEWEGTHWETSIACEWLQWKLTTWTSLHGATLDSSVDAEEVECTLYLADHHWVELAAVRLERVPGGARFRIRIEGSFDLYGFDEDIDGTAIPVSVDAEVEFSGILVLPGNLSPKPTNARAAAEELLPFIGLEGLDPPVWTGSTFLFAPNNAE